MTKRQKLETAKHNIALCDINDYEQMSDWRIDWCSDYFEQHECLKDMNEC